jgi:hypothetical protein
MGTIHLPVEGRSDPRQDDPSADGEGAADPSRILRRHAHRIGRLPAWMLARELGVSVEDIQAYVQRHGLANPLRPSTLRPR